MKRSQFSYLISPYMFNEISKNSSWKQTGSHFKLRRTTQEVAMPLCLCACFVVTLFFVVAVAAHLTDRLTP